MVLPLAGFKQVAAGKHQRPALDLRGLRQGNVDGHLVAVEVRVVGVTDQGMKLYGLAFDQHGFEGLDAQAVQGRSAVQEHGMLAHHLVQDGEDFGGFLLHEHLGLLDVVDNILFHELLHDEGLEELQGHLGGQAALVHLELRADHDHGTAGIVDALAQEVLAEAALLALEHVREGLERPVGGALDDALLLGVVEEGVHGFLEHPLLVADDDVRRVQGLQPLQAVVAVDDAAVEVVEVARGETAAVQLHHGSEFRRDDGNDVQNHPLRAGSGSPEVLHDFDAFQEALVALRALFDHPDPQVRGHLRPGRVCSRSDRMASAPMPAVKAPPKRSWAS